MVQGFIEAKLGVDGSTNYCNRINATKRYNDHTTGTKPTASSIWQMDAHTCDHEEMMPTTAQAATAAAAAAGAAASAAASAEASGNRNSITNAIIHCRR